MKIKKAKIKEEKEDQRYLEEKLAAQDRKNLGVIKHSVRTKSREGSALVGARVKIVGYGDNSSKGRPDLGSTMRNANDTTGQTGEADAHVGLPQIN